MGVTIRQNEIVPLIAILEEAFSNGLIPDSQCHAIDELLERLYEVH